MEREDTSTVHLYFENGGITWSHEEKEHDFKIVRPENYMELNNLINEKGLSVKDLTLILETIALKSL